tara:strand:+ start:4345 stop:4701 length:357 start_codon:yes stop_codon:yes gene_type:complete
MSPRKTGKGSQKKARFERLKEEILNFVGANPGCSAQSIVANLSHDRAMRNHGLTPRKVGFFIPVIYPNVLSGGRTILQVVVCMESLGVSRHPKNSEKQGFCRRLTHVWCPIEHLTWEE